MSEGVLTRIAPTLVAALLFTATVAPGARALEITTIVLEGDDAPGAPFFFSTFMTLLFLPNALTAPVVDENGRGSFLSNVPGGIWAGDGGPLDKIVATLDPVPGGGEMSSIVSQWRGGGGYSVLYTSVLRNQSDLVWVLYSDGPGGLTLLAEEGAAAPGTPGVFELTFNVPPQVGSSGEYAFTAQLEPGVGGVDGGNDDGIWAGIAGGSLDLLLREADPAPGFDALAATRCIPTLDGSGSDPATPVVNIAPGAPTPVALARSGTLAMVARIDGCDPPSRRDVLWLREVGQLPKVVAMYGDEVSGAGSQLQGIATIALSDNGALAFMGSAFHNPGIGVGVWSLTTEGSVEAVAIPGDSIAGLPQGTHFQSSFANPSVADSGRVAFQAAFINDSNTISGEALIAAGGELPACAFAVEGAPAPGAPDAVFGDFGNIFIRNQVFGSDASGNVAFLMELKQGVGGVDATNDLGLWRRALSGPVELIARTGDMLEVAPGDVRTIANLVFAGEAGTLPGHGGGIGPDGEVAFWASFTDNSQGVFVTNPVSTEPSVFMCPEPCLTLGGDSDQDGICDGSKTSGDQPCSCQGIFAVDCRDGCDDNCPFAKNADQLDRGDVGSSAPDGIGDACQCGDINVVASAHNGVVDENDEDLLRQFLAGLASLEPAALEKCSVIGGPDECSILTWVGVKRGLQTPPKSPGIVADGCRAFVGP